LPPVRVAATDGLAFVSSNALTVATAALAVADLDDLAEAADRVAALSHLGLLGAMEAYDARALAAKHDPWAAGVAERLRHLLGDGPEPARLQDPFALRTVPQVHGTLREALATARSALTAEIGAGSENPLVTDDAVLHHGHFLTQRLATSLDTVRAAAHPFAALSAARTSALMDPRLTGLPPFLAADTAGSSGLMILEYVAADLVTRARRLAAPTTTGAVLSLGLEEHASFSTQGARAARELTDVLGQLLGCELVAAVRALRLAPERALDCPARELLERGRAVLPDVPDDHVLGPDIRAAMALLLEPA
jgi:histidine ammonia-lyase